MTFPRASNARSNTSQRISKAATIAITLGLVSTSFLLTAQAAQATTGTYGTSTLASNGVSTLQPRPLEAVGSLVTQRLALAEPVAESKWLSKKPISDPAREQVVIDEAVALAKRQGIDPELVSRTLRAQIEASKVIQRGLITRWAHDPASAPTNAPDLASVRPKLDAIDNALVTAIGTVAHAAAEPRCSSLVDAERSASYAGMDSLRRKAVHTAWATFCAA
ncbi:gamma subclass chorismate mutase AroQ [Curtobacterium flaccumfaciens pv. oortii]|uniref:gamma subclass chorismate mutase AroQ n=1 Tax=Curtobacterium flaccumfaciens TaxID=2035 RepID=UPI0026593585|nr:gamma subclass chorismate mutase AroQ [Curtobacterium flaccumfaciens]MCS5524648.1 gamma subclass chorismate mutase AroQ [Curtobacterium flaccumfaciens pv. oortii]